MRAAYFLDLVAVTLPSTRAAIAFGSNLGDRAHHISAAVAALRATPGVHVDAVSRLIETAPVGPVSQGPFLNAAATLRTTLSPEALLARLMEIERAQGRDRSAGERWGPRTLDLDLLLYGRARLHSATLTLPHPRLHERRFVLQPLSEIAPTWQVPGRASVLQLLAALPRDSTT